MSFCFGSMRTSAFSISPAEPGLSVSRKRLPPWSSIFPRMAENFPESKACANLDWICAVFSLNHLAVFGGIKRRRVKPKPVSIAHEEIHIGSGSFPADLVGFFGEKNAPSFFSRDSMPRCNRLARSRLARWGLARNELLQLGAAGGVSSPWLRR